MNAIASTAPYCLARPVYVPSADKPRLPPSPAPCARCHQLPDVTGDVRGVCEAELIVVGYAVQCACGATGPVCATPEAACVAWSTAQWAQYRDDAPTIDPAVERAALEHRRAVVRECARRWRAKRSVKFSARL